MLGAPERAVCGCAATRSGQRRDKGDRQNATACFMGYRVPLGGRLVPADCGVTWRDVGQAFRLRHPRRTRRSLPAGWLRRDSPAGEATAVGPAMPARVTAIRVG